MFVPGERRPATRARRRESDCPALLQHRPPSAPPNGAAESGTPRRGRRQAVPDTNYTSSILTTYRGTSGHPLLHIVFLQVIRNVLFSNHLTFAEGTGGSENAPERMSCGCPFWRGAPAQRRIHNAFDVEHENGASWGLDLDVGREPRAGGGRPPVACGCAARGGSRARPDPLGGVNTSLSLFLSAISPHAPHPFAFPQDSTGEMPEDTAHVKKRHSKTVTNSTYDPYGFYFEQFFMQYRDRNMQSRVHGRHRLAKRAP